MSTQVKKARPKGTDRKIHLSKLRITRPPVVALLRNLRKGFGLSGLALARMIGVSGATLVRWEKTGKVSAQDRKSLKKVQETLAGLNRVMRKDFIPTWLEAPNEACAAAGGRTPLDLMEKGKYDKIKAMIYFLESGTPV
jgi:transcriptional regulator with XRE-family HTH domain